MSVALLASAPSFAADVRADVGDDSAYLQAQRLVEIEPGRRLNIHCKGSGSPTVIFESGLAEPTSTWFRVQPVIANRTRTCSYDRAGAGFSDPGKRAGSSANIVDDLHRLLAAADIAPPYVLVGHSYGGMNVRLYADTYPSEVVGMVLVDPSHEDQSEGYRKLSPRKLSREAWEAEQVPGLQARRECIAAAANGIMPGTEAYKKCIFVPDARFSEPLKEAYLAMQQRPGFHQAQLTEEENMFTASAEQLRATRHDHGDMPLVVLTQSPSQHPLRSWETQELREARTRMWVELHDQLARQSVRGINRIVADSDHSIQLGQPKAVTDAIFEVLDAAGAKLQSKAGLAPHGQRSAPSAAKPGTSAAD